MSMPSESRDNIRHTLLARRLELPLSWRLQADGALCAALRHRLEGHLRELGRQAVIGCYWPIQGEPDLRSLWSDWPLVALPRVVGKACAL